MAPNRPGRGAGRIEQHHVGWRRRAPFQSIGFDDLGFEAEPREVLPETGEARGGAVEGDDSSAGRCELRSLSAGGGADLQHALARDSAEQGGRQRCGRILHPPLTRLVARKARHLPGAAQPERASGQTLCTERGTQRLAAVLRVGDRREVEWRLAHMGLGDGPAGCLAVGFRPAIPEPVRGIEAGRVELGDCAVLAAGAAQHRVDQPSIGREPRSVRERDGARHCRMGRRFQEGELADSEAQHVLHRPPPRRQGTVHQTRQKGVDLAEQAERGEQQQPRKGCVARGKRVRPRRGGERLVQGAAPAHDRAQGMGCDGARVARRARAYPFHTETL